jgi:hypothetical protein
MKWPVGGVAHTRKPTKPRGPQSTYRGAHPPSVLPPSMRLPPLSVLLPLSVRQASTEVPLLDETRVRHDPLTSLSTFPGANRLGTSGSLPAGITGLFRDSKSKLQPILLQQGPSQTQKVKCKGRGGSLVDECFHEMIGAGMHCLLLVCSPVIGGTNVNRGRLLLRGLRLALLPHGPRGRQERSELAGPAHGLHDVVAPSQVPGSKMAQCRVFASSRFPHRFQDFAAPSHL